MAVVDVICRAINERRLLSFTYKSEARIAEPFILGYDEHGDLLLSAVQTAGGSGVGFRTFPIEGVTSLKVMTRSSRASGRNTIAGTGFSRGSSARFRVAFRPLPPP